MDFVIPINCNGKVYGSGVIDKPRGGIIADTAEELKRTGIYGAMLKFISGCLVSITDKEGEEITEKKAIERVCRHMTIHLAEVVSLRILTLSNKEGLEQISKCPRCKRERIYEGDESITFDDLEIMPYTEDQKIKLVLESPIEIKSRDKLLWTVNSMTMRFPTLQDGIKGESRVAEEKEIRMQFAIYSASMISVNGDPVEDKFRNQWGGFLFDRMYNDDLEKISEVLREIGIKKTVERRCRCGKEWREPIDLSDFFVSGLHLEN